jgi:energy-coupling factor transporter transmembrane protein EcfT
LIVGTRKKHQSGRSLRIAVLIFVVFVILIIVTIPFVFLIVFFLVGFFSQEYIGNQRVMGGACAGAFWMQSAHAQSYAVSLATVARTSKIALERRL